MVESHFNPHGSIDIKVDNDLISLDIKGPCNTEFFELMANKLALFRPQLNMNNYTGLIILRDEALATPEAMAYFTSYLKTIQVRAVALNLQYTHSPSATEDMCRKAYTEAGVTHRFFFDNLSATTWLRQCMSTPR
jgi:hypothetical protein